MSSNSTSASFTASLETYGVVGDDLHAERLGAPGHLAADVAEADDAQDLALQFVAQEFLLLPFARFRRGAAPGTERASERMKASVCSATATALPPGVFITTTPRAVAASQSTLSTPTPARPTTRSLGASANSSLVILTALRISTASASARCLRYSLALETMTLNSGSALSASTAAGGDGVGNENVHRGASVLSAAFAAR